MPTYAYRCPEGHEFDRVQKISEPAGATCPQCGRAAQRIITGGAGLVFKGSGFYITDYKRAGKTTAEGKRSKGKGSSGEGSGGKETGSAGGESASRDAKKRDADSSDS